MTFKQKYPTEIETQRQDVEIEEWGVPQKRKKMEGV